MTFTRSYIVGYFLYKFFRIHDSFISLAGNASCSCTIHFGHAGILSKLVHRNVFFKNMRKLFYVILASITNSILLILVSLQILPDSRYDFAMHFQRLIYDFVKSRLYDSNGQQQLIVLYFMFSSYFIALFYHLINQFINI